MMENLTKLMLISDVVTAVSFLILAITTYLFVKKVRPGASLVLLAFLIFLFADSLTSFLETYTAWESKYWVVLAVKAAAAASGAVAVLITVLSKQSLARFIRQAQTSKEKDAELRKAYAEMERRVENRTKDLMEVNAALAHSEEKYRTTFDLAGIGIAHIALDGTIMMANSSLHTIMGFGGNELVGTNAKEYLHPDDITKLTNIFERSLTGELSHYFHEPQYKGKNGVYIWARSTISLARDSSGNPDYFVAIIEDNAQQQQIEKSLRESESRLRRLMDANILGVSFFDSESGMIWEANNAFLKMLGVTEEELKKGQVTWRNMTPPQWVDADNKAMKEYYEKGSFAPFEKEYIRKDGTILPVLVGATRLKEEGDRGVGFALDLTELRATQKNLAESETKFKLIIETIPNLVWMAKPNGDNIFFNKQWHEYTGLSIDDSKGAGWRKTVHPDDLQLMLTEKNSWFDAIRKGTEYVTQYRVRSASGEYRWHLVRALPLRDDRGTIKFWFGTCTDIHDQKVAEEALKKSQEQLEKVIEIRTCDLRDVNQALSTTNLELEAFCYSISHDLRAPLRGIDGFTQALAEDYSPRLDSQGLKYISFVRDSVKRMGQMIDDLLNLSRYSRAELNKEEVNLSQEAEKIIGRYRIQDPNRNVDFICQPDMVDVADPGLITSVLENLLSNAWKFTQNTKLAKIEFGFKRTLELKTYFIKDNGEGFDPRYTNKLFGVFQRLHSAEDFDGTGIGLAICRRIIVRHGGKIWAESKPKNGATFYFTLK